MDILAEMMGKWSTEVNLWSTLIKILAAIVFSSIIGGERARKRHAAGLRTFMLAAIGATLSGVCDLYLINTYNVSIPFISAALVIGIAIISCNAILFSSKNQLKGLTTSVCLWVLSIICVALGLGMYTAFLIGLAALIMSLMIFPNLEIRFKERSNHFEIHLELNSRNLLREFTDSVREFGLRINDIEINPAYANTGLGVYSVILTVESKELKKKTHKEIAEILASLECVHHIEIID